jgi:hypothetical protein
VRGNGDGGVYTTVDDMHRLWAAFLAGRIVTPAAVEQMVHPHSDPADSQRYGLGFWLGADNDSVELEGYDAGASFRSTRYRSAGVTFTVASNTSNGAWPIAKFLNTTFDALAS